MNAQHAESMTGTHDPVLVALSVAIAVVASFVALDLAGRIRASAGRARWAWLATAAVAMGGSIWSMHFVAMLAFLAPVPVAYAPGLTALSLALPILVTGGGFAAASRPGVRAAGVGLGGLLMGVGIAMMHYTGMAAMRVPADLSYDAALVVASVLIAIGASTAALWLAFRDTSVHVRAAAAVCMGGAISAMHYTAMAAASFAAHGAGHGPVDAAPGQATLGQAGLALAVAATTFLVLFLALLAALVDRRLATLAEREAAALRESEEQFRTLYRSTPLPLHSLDAEGRILQVSDAWLELLGYARAEVVGRPLTDFMTPASAERRRAVEWPHILAGGELRGAESGFVTRDGRTLTTLLSSRVQRDADGRFVRTLSGMIDVTAHRRAEEALRHAQKMEAVGQLTGGVAHDFNNLLTAILGSIALLERHIPGEERPRRLLEAARQAVRRGTQLSGSLLAFARRQPLRPEPVDANALLQEAITLVRRALGETVVLELAFDPSLPPCLADPAQLQAAVLNLAINARDAMPTGGTLSIRTAAAALGAADLVGNEDASPGAFVALSVRDTGHGMTPEVLARAFEPFFTTKEVGKGTGLGLSQVYGFVRQLGGHVAVESTPGRGTAVALFLPVAEAAVAGAAAAAQAAAPREVAAGGAPAGLARVASATALVVEDEASVRDATAEVLREAGWRVLTAGDGREALRVLEDGQAVDVLFSDVVMPGGMTGVELARATRRLRPGIGVLLASGYAGTALGAAGGEFEVLAKPYEPAELLARLAAAAPAQGRAATGAA